MTPEDIIVGATYMRDGFRFLGVGKRIMFKGRLDNKASFSEKHLVSINYDENHGLIIKEGAECGSNFWEEVKLIEKPPK